MNTDFNSALSGVTDTTNRLQEAVQQKARQYSEITDRYVHDNAWKTIAIAALVGCLIGFLVSSQRERGDRTVLD